MSTRQRRKMLRIIDLAIARGWRPGLSVRDVLRRRTRREAGKSAQ
jgi:hypothetical protein